jgi:hypothetical protein
MAIDDSPYINLERASWTPMMFSKLSKNIAEEPAHVVGIMRRPSAEVFHDYCAIFELMFVDGMILKDAAGAAETLDGISRPH